MSNSLPTGYSLHRPVREDIPAMVALVNAQYKHDLDKDRVTTVELLEQTWDMPDLEPENNGWMLFAPDGSLAGYTLSFAMSPHYNNVNVEVGLLPDHRGQGIEDTLLRMSLEHAHEKYLPLAPPEARVTANQGFNSQYTWMRELFKRHGFKVVRGFWQMRIDMEAPPPAPHWPDDIHLKPYHPETDSHALFDAVEDAFKDHWGYSTGNYERWLKMRLNLPGYDPALWFLIYDGDEIAGFSLAYHESREDENIAYVAELGVRRQWRRRGLALALLQHTFSEIYRQGRASVILHVDAESLTGATRLYEKAGMYAAEDAINVELELRPGMELRTQSLEEESSG